MIHATHGIRNYKKRKGVKYLFQNFFQQEHGKMNLWTGYSRIHTLTACMPKLPKMRRSRMAAKKRSKRTKRRRIFLRLFYLVVYWSWIISRLIT